MTTNRKTAARILVTTMLVSLAGSLATAASAAAPPGRAQQGKQLFLANGCYSCHGTTGTGDLVGPRLGPGPIPWAAFLYQLRHPSGTPSYGAIRMPMFGPAVLTDAQAADIYAYLSSIKPGPPASSIALLKP